MILRASLKSGQSVKAILLAVLPPLLILSLWQGVCSTHLFSAAILVPPGRVWHSFVVLAQNGQLARNLEASGLRVLIGFSAGAASGLAFGALLGLFPLFERYVGMVFHMVRQIPSIAWVPLLMIVFGIQETFKIVLIAKAAFFPIALGTLDGVRNVPASYRDVARVFRFGRASLIRKLVLPAALPAIVTGLRLGLSRAWMMLVAAELFASSVGIGHMMDWGRQLFHIDIVMVGVVLVALIGFIFDRALRAAEAHFSRWRIAAP